jgi:hypothetical protein
MTKTAVIDPREQETKDKREKTKIGMVQIRREKTSMSKTLAVYTNVTTEIKYTTQDTRGIKSGAKKTWQKYNHSATRPTAQDTIA